MNGWVARLSLTTDEFHKKHTDNRHDSKTWWVGSLADAFRTERFELVSTRSRTEIADAAVGMGANRRIGSRIMAAFAPPVAGEVLVTGRATSDRLRLMIPTWYQNSWEPTLRVELRDDPAGTTRALCEIGPHPVTKWFSFAWLALASLFLIPAVAAGPTAVLFLLLFPLFALGLSSLGGRLGRPGRFALRQVAGELAGPHVQPSASPSNGA